MNIKQILKYIVGYSLIITGILTLPLPFPTGSIAMIIAGLIILNNERLLKIIKKWRKE